MRRERPQNRAAQGGPRPSPPSPASCPPARGSSRGNSPPRNGPPQPPLAFRRQTVSRAPLQRLVHSPLNVGVGMAQDQRPPCADVIQQVVAVGVNHLRTPPANDEP